MMNDPYAPQSAIIAPRLRIKANGVVIPGALKASINSNNFYQCDHFSASFVMALGPANWWDVDPPLMIEIEFSTDGTAWPPALFIGEVDHIQTHIQTGIIEMEGRDLSARFIEAKTQAAYPNKTSSEVVTMLAAKHGMTAVVTPTTALVGRYYSQDHTKVSLGQFGKVTTEWDMLVFLAQREGFDVFMQGAALHFQPWVNPASDPYVLNWTPPTPANPVSRLNAISLNLERSLTLAKDVQVTVQSWHGRQGRSFQRVGRAIGGKQSGQAFQGNAGASSAGDSTNRQGGKKSGGGSTHGSPIATQNYVVVRPNLTEDEAQQLANSLAHEITLHERIVSVEMPGELTLTPRNMALLQGTGTSFDQPYYIASIERSISFEEGFRQSLRLKNSSPRTQVMV